MSNNLSEELSVWDWMVHLFNSILHSIPAPRAHGKKGAIAKNAYNEFLKKVAIKSNGLRSVNDAKAINTYRASQHVLGEFHNSQRLYKMCCIIG